MSKADQQDVEALRQEYVGSLRGKLRDISSEVEAEVATYRKRLIEARTAALTADFGARMAMAGVNVTQLQYIIGTKAWDATTKWKTLVGLNPSATREEDKTLRKISNVPGKPVWNEDYSEFRITEGPKGEALDLVFNVKDGLIMHTPQFPRTPYQIRHMKLMMDSIKAGQKAFGDGFFRVLSGILEAAIQAGKAEVEKK